MYIMNLGTGTRKVGGRVSKAKPKSRATRNKRTRRRTKVSLIPKTATISSRKSIKKFKKSRADSSMSLTELQFMARSKGIPFGGLSRTKLIKKINNYTY